MAGKAARKAGAKPGPPHAAGAALSAVPAGLPPGGSGSAMGGRSTSPPTPPAGGAAYKRCSSLASLSDCSAESRDTDVSMATSGGRRSLDGPAALAARAPGKPRRQPLLVPLLGPGSRAVTAAPTARALPAALSQRVRAHASLASDAAPVTSAASSAMAGPERSTTWAAKVAGERLPAALPAAAPSAAAAPQQPSSALAPARARELARPAPPCAGEAAASAVPDARAVSGSQAWAGERCNGGVAAALAGSEEERLRGLVAELVRVLSVL